MNLKMSRYLALSVGLILPILETVRRIRTGGHIVWWLDDYLIGIALVIGGLMTKANPETGRPFLSAAWGMTCGMGYVSFFSHLLSPHAQSERYNGPVTYVVGFGMILAICGLIGSLETSSTTKNPVRDA